MSDVWVKTEAIATAPADGIQSPWSIGNPREDAKECLRFAAELAEVSGGQVMIYGPVCASIKGQRVVQRWLVSHDLPYGWVAYEQEPPEGAEVIDQWPMNTGNS